MVARGNPTSFSRTKGERYGRLSSLMVYVDRVTIVLSTKERPRNVYFIRHTNDFRFHEFAIPRVTATAGRVSLPALARRTVFT